MKFITIRSSLDCIVKKLNKLSNSWNKITIIDKIMCMQTFPTNELSDCIMIYVIKLEEEFGED